MDAVDIVSLTSPDAVKIKLEYIESEPENALEQTRQSLLNSQEADKIISKVEPPSETDYDFLDDKVTVDIKEEELKDICNTINDYVEVININGNCGVRGFNSGEPVTGLQKKVNNAQTRIGLVKSLDELIGKTIDTHNMSMGKTNDTNMENGQIIQKTMETKAALLSMDKKDDDAVYEVQEIVNVTPIRRIVRVKSLDELTGKTNSTNVQCAITVKPMETLANGCKKDDSLNISATKYSTDRKIYDDEIIKVDRLYGCAYCSYINTSRQHIKHHIRFYHKNTAMNRGSSQKHKRTLRQCPYCSKQSKYLDVHIYNRHTDHEDINWHFCYHCGHKTKSKESLKLHIMARHTISSLYGRKVCKECGKKFRNIDYLNSHIKQVHHLELMKKYKCDFCPYTTIKEAEFKCHMSRHVPLGDGFKCIKCSFTATKAVDLRRHGKSEHTEWFLHRNTNFNMRSRQCPYCLMQCTDLVGHVYNCHTDSEDISWLFCYHCDYKTKAKQSLKYHMMAKHTNPSLCEFKVCKECGRKFRSLGILNIHIKEVHHPESMKRYKCDFCPYTTFRRCGLKYHMPIHIPLKDGFKCSICSFTATKPSKLRKHRESEHSEWIRCHLCVYKCKNNSSMKVHLIRHLKKKKQKGLILECQKCDYKTYRPYKLKVHKLEHKKPNKIEMFQCCHCNFQTERKSNLEDHIFTQHIYKTVLACFICSFEASSKYELKKHVATHSEEEKKADLIKLSVKIEGMNAAATKKDEKNDESTKRAKKNDENINKTQNILNDDLGESLKNQEKSEEKNCWKIMRKRSIGNKNA